MSKSLGNVIDPIAQLDKYGTDSVRYYLLKEIPSDDDGDYTEEVFIERNNELANNLGNVVYRILTLVEKNFDGKVPNKYNGHIEKIFKEVPKKIENNIDEFKLHIALNEALRFISEINKYTNDKAPWKIENKKELENVLYELTESLRLISILIYPFLPGTSEKIFEQLGLDKKDILWKNLKYGLLKSGTNVKKGEVLFRKIENNAKTAVMPTIKKIEGVKNLITIQDFGKVELKVATILEAEAVEGSDKLVKLQIDVGEKKQIVAGIRKAYSPEELVGKQIIVVNNLQPAKLKGIESNGMLLAAVDNEPVLLTVDKKVKNGTKIS